MAFQALQPAMAVKVAPQRPGDRIVRANTMVVAGGLSPALDSIAGAKSSGTFQSVADARSHQGPTKEEKSVASILGHLQSIEVQLRGLKKGAPETQAWIEKEVWPPLKSLIRSMEDSDGRLSFHAELSCFDMILNCFDHINTLAPVTHQQHNYAWQTLRIQELRPLIPSFIKSIPLSIAAEAEKNVINMEGVKRSLNLMLTLSSFCDETDMATFFFMSSEHIVAALYRMQGMSDQVRPKLQMILIDVFFRLPKHLNIEARSALPAALLTISQISNKDTIFTKDVRVCAIAIGPLKGTPHFSRALSALHSLLEKVSVESPISDAIDLIHQELFQDGKDCSAWLHDWIRFRIEVAGMKNAPFHEKWDSVFLYLHELETELKKRNIPFDKSILEKVIPQFLAESLELPLDGFLDSLGILFEQVSLYAVNPWLSRAMKTKDSISWLEDWVLARMEAEGKSNASFHHKWSAIFLFINTIQKDLKERKLHFNEELFHKMSSRFLIEIFQLPAGEKRNASIRYLFQEALVHRKNPWFVRAMKAVIMGFNRSTPHENLYPDFNALFSKYLAPILRLS